MEAFGFGFFVVVLGFVCLLAIGFCLYIFLVWVFMGGKVGSEGETGPRIALSSQVGCTGPHGVRLLC